MQLQQLHKGDTIQVIGRRWFQKTYGNTYHSVEVYVNSEFVGKISFQYGYGNQYTQSARALLEKYYKLPIEENEALWKLKNHGVKVLDSVTDVERKKDL